MATKEPTHTLSSLAQLAAENDCSLPEGLSVLDHLLFGVIQEGLPPSFALAAYKNLISGFHNFNEIRVSHPQEIAALLEGVSDAETKARRILDILRFAFDTTYSF